MLSLPDVGTVDGPVLATKQLACGGMAGSVDSKKAGNQYDSPVPLRLTKARLETHRRSFGKEKPAQTGRQQQVQVSAAGAITQKLTHAKSDV
jgi:hypothetical protein